MLQVVACSDHLTLLLLPDIVFTEDSALFSMVSAMDDIHAPPASTLVNCREIPRCSLLRRIVLLSFFCFATLLDSIHNAAIVCAIPRIVSGLDMTAIESTWITSAYHLTFASFLLIVSCIMPQQTVIDIDDHRVEELLTSIVRVHCTYPPK